MNNQQEILILGASSFIGGHLLSHFGTRAVGTYRSRVLEGGILFDALSMSLKSILPLYPHLTHALLLLVNTRAERCSEDEELSRATNIDAVLRLIEDLASAGIKPVFFSSDLVFDGRQGHYSETSPPNPITVYGRQKLEIENHLRDNVRDFLIVRLSKTYGLRPEDNTLFTNWLRDFETKSEIYCAADQIFSPIFVGDVVEAVSRLIDNKLSGLFHLTGPKCYRRIELLNLLLIEIRKYRPLNLQIIPCSINDFGLPERQPLNTSLSAAKLIAETEIKLRSVEELLPELLKVLPENS